MKYYWKDGELWRGPTTGTMRYAKFYGHCLAPPHQEIWVLEKHDLFSDQVEESMAKDIISHAFNCRFGK